MTDLEKLLAYEEIRQLASRYAHALDSRDWDALVELYLEEVEVPDGTRGKAALRKWYFSRMRDRYVTILNVGTHVIDLVDETLATGVVYCHCEMGDENRWVQQMVGYADTYRRSNGRWYFSNRDHQLFYGQVIDRSPMAQPPTTWPATQVGRGTLPGSWPSWQKYNRTRTDGS